MIACLVAVLVVGVLMFGAGYLVGTKRPPEDR